jgi:hypothetical protein
MTDLFAFAEAKRQRDAGMQQAAAHAEDFCEFAYACLVRIARRQVHLHIDDLLLELDGRRPASPNAMGSIWMRAIRNGVIQHSNQTRPCITDAGKHAHRYPIYFSRIHDPRCA